MPTSVQPNREQLKAILLLIEDRLMFHENWDDLLHDYPYIAETIDRLHEEQQV